MIPTTNMPSLASKVALGLLMALLGACTQEAADTTADDHLVLGRVEQTEVVERAVSPGTRMLVVQGFHGSVDLTGTDDPVAHLTFTKRVRGRDESEARALLQQVQIQESGGDEQYLYTLRSDQPTLSAVDVRGDVPRGTSLRLELQSGKVTFTDLEGTITVQNQHGGADITGARASVTVETRNGSLTVGFAHLAPDANVRLQTANGDVTLRLPEDASARIDARTNVGEITLEGLTFSKRGLDLENAGAHFTGQLGQGRSAIDLQTENGSIALQAQAPAPPIFMPEPVPSADPDTLEAPQQDVVVPVPADTSREQ